MKIKIKKFEDTSYFPATLSTEDPLDRVIQWHVYFSCWISWVHIKKGICILREDLSDLTLSEIRERVEVEIINGKENERT